MIQQPNFTGTWHLSLSKSRLEIPAPAATTFIVDHRDRVFRLTRTHIYGDQSDTLTFEFTTDGREHRRLQAGLETRARMRWDGASLVVQMQFNRNGEEGSEMVRYELADDGRTFIASESLRTATHQHNNVWVFDKE